AHFQTYATQPDYSRKAIVEKPKPSLLLKLTLVTSFYF
ncbi:unnamed protein product, partial [marine sediment metagenome]